MVELLEVVSHKGCKIAPSTIEKLLEITGKNGNSEDYAKIENIGLKKIGKETIEGFKLKYPLITLSAENKKES